MEKKEAMKILKDFHDKSALFSVRTALHTIIPELNKSEDNMIKEELIKHLKDGVEGYMPAGDSEDYTRWLTWVEKQGKETSEKEFTFKALPRLLEMIEVSDRAKAYTEKLAVALDNEGYHTDAKIVRESIKIMNGEEVSMATMDEQKPVDNIEPKFKVGDWITNGDYTWKIVEVKPLDYILQSQDSNIVDDTISHVDEQFHSFTVKDAKDGDVLIDKSGSRECPFIFKETKPSDIKTDVPNPLTVFGYCGIGGAGFTKSSGWGDTANCIYHPATKEQRDTLFLKMKEAGYEWSEETHELKKISQRMVSAEAKEALYDKPTDEEMKELLRTEYEKGRADTIAEMKSSWSEEDERAIGIIKIALKHPYDMEGKWDRKFVLDWLKSLRPQNTWKPSEEQMNTLNLIISDYYHACTKECDKKAIVLKSILEQLKQL